MKAVALLIMRQYKEAFDLFEDAYGEAIKLAGPDNEYTAGYCKANILAMKGHIDASREVEKEIGRLNCDKELRGLLPHK